MKRYKNEFPDNSFTSHVGYWRYLGSYLPMINSRTFELISANHQTVDLRYLKKARTTIELFGDDIDAFLERVDPLDLVPTGEVLAPRRWCIFRKLPVCESFPLGYSPNLPTKESGVSRYYVVVADNNNKFYFEDGYTGAFNGDNYVKR